MSRPLCWAINLSLASGVSPTMDCLKSRMICFCSSVSAGTTPGVVAPTKGDGVEGFSIVDEGGGSTVEDDWPGIAATAARVLLLPPADSEDGDTDITWLLTLCANLTGFWDAAPPAIGGAIDEEVGIIGDTWEDILGIPGATGFV